MGNTLLGPTIIAKESLMQLRNYMVMANLVHRDFKKEFVKIGESVTVRKPVKFLANDGQDITNNIQTVSEDSITFTINKWKNVAWNFSNRDMTLTIEEYSKRYIQPACIALANQVDFDLLALYKDIFFAAGSAGTTPATFAAFGAAAQKLDEAACPQDQRYLVLNPAAKWSMADALKGIFHQKKVAGYLERGYLGTMATCDIMADQNVNSHTKGTATGTPLANGASQTGASLVTDGWSNSITALNKGDIFTMPLVYAVNPVNYQSTGQLQQFVATSDATSDGSGDCTISISPSIITSGAYQTVTASPANNAPLTVESSHVANIAFNKNAFGLVTVPIELPEGASWKGRMSKEGLSVRVIKDYDIKTNAEIIRLDMMYGVKTLYPELACRLMG